MSTQLSDLDNRLFDFFNRELTWEPLKEVALFLSNNFTWWATALLVLALGVVLRKKGWVKSLVLCGIALGVTDFTTSQILKKEFQRPRPCHQRAVILRAGSCGSPFGMPSNHAANGAAVFVASSFFVKGPALGVLGGLVFLVGWSRIYLGVHFPFDVLVGWGVGALLGFLTARSLLKLGTYLRSFR